MPKDKKDQGASLPAANLHSSTFCFETRPLLATLVALALVTFLWNIQPYPNTSNSLNIPNNNVTISKNTKLAHPNPNNKRVFTPYGNAAALFVQMGAYRGGPDTFAVIGLASKPIHIFARPYYKCKWVSNNGSVVKSKAYKMLPDWGYGRVYTVVVVNCTFPNGNPNADNSGGKLILQAYYDDRDPTRRFEKIVAMEEVQGAYNETKYTPPYDYEYLYCGSSLYGDVNADRMREWMAYHAWFFGSKSHFVFHDAGGVSAEVMSVLEPWVRNGRVTVQDIRDQSEYDGYYYNQFLIVNDCLHRYRYAANWTFFFDVDEYIYLPDGRSLESVLAELSPFTQFTIEQNPMSSSLCLLNGTTNTSTVWGFEKLVFREARTGIRRDRKYAIQAKYAYSTGVHMSENVTGNTTHNTESMIRYFHYHNTITIPGELCRDLVTDTAKTNTTWRNELPYVYDDRMKQLAPAVKVFEKDTLNLV